MSNYRDRKRKPIAEINVVPYIDVMLVLLTVTKEGNFFVDDLEKTPQEILTYAVGLLREKPTTDFLVRGDKQALYDDVLQAMVLLKLAGVESVSLVTEPIPN